MLDHEGVPVDILAHYHMFDYRARCAVAVTTEIVRELQKRHQLDPVTTIAVGRAVSCAALLASVLKSGQEYVHMRFAGEGGLLEKVIAECNGDGHCRGYAVPPRLLEVMSPGDEAPGSVGEALGGRGLLTVTRGLPVELGGPYNAVSALENGEIATDIARYLTDSEQIPSAVAAGVKLALDGSVLAAGGVLVQKLGGAVLEEAELTAIEERMRQQLSISDRIAAGQSSDEIVAFLQGDIGQFGLLMTRPLTFKCTCTHDKMMRALVALGEDELNSILKETGKLAVRCQYCAEEREFRLAELIKH